MSHTTNILTRSTNRGNSTLLGEMEKRKKEIDGYIQVGVKAEGKKPETSDPTGRKSVCLLAKLYKAKAKTKNRC